MLAIDLVIVTGQSNAGIAVTNEITESINGVDITGSVFALSALKASQNLGLGNGGVLVLASSPENYTSEGSIYGDTALLPGSTSSNPTWYAYVNNKPSQGVVASNLENLFAQWCRDNAANFVNAGIAIKHIDIVSMHNENDDTNLGIGNSQTNLTDWEIAKLDQMADVASAFHMPAGSVTMSFVWVPSNYATAGGGQISVQFGNDANTQSGGQNEYIEPYTSYYAYAQYNLQAAQWAMAGDPTHTHMYIAGQYGDASMRGDGNSGDSGTYGNLHFYLPATCSSQPFCAGTPADTPNDFQPGGQAASFVTRLSNHISNIFAADAVTGSVVARNGYHMDSGPVATGAALVNDGTREHIIVTFAMDPLAPTFGPLDGATKGHGDGNLGAGWSVASQGAPNQIYATQATVIQPNEVELTLSSPVPNSSNDLLYYMGIWDGHIVYTDYYDHIVSPGTNPGYTEANGEKDAVYDSLGMPILVSALGIKISAPSD